MEYRDRTADPHGRPASTLVDAFRAVDAGFSEESIERAVAMAGAWSARIPRPEYGAVGMGAPGSIKRTHLTLETGWNMANWVDATKTLKPRAYKALKRISLAAGIWHGQLEDNFVDGREVGTDVEFATTIGFLSALAALLAGRKSTLVFTQNKVRLTKSPEAIVSTMIRNDGADLAFPYAMWVGRWTDPQPSGRKVPDFSTPPRFATLVEDANGARVTFSLKAMKADPGKYLPQFGCGGVVVTRKAAAYLLLVRSMYRFRADDENLMDALSVLADLSYPFVVSAALPTKVDTGWGGVRNVPVVSETAFARYDFRAPSTH